MCHQASAAVECQPSRAAGRHNDRCWSKAMPERHGRHVRVLIGAAFNSLLTLCTALTFSALVHACMSLHFTLGLQPVEVRMFPMETATQFRPECSQQLFQALQQCNRKRISEAKQRNCALDMMLMEKVVHRHASPVLAAQLLSFFTDLSVQ